MIHEVAHERVMEILAKAGRRAATWVDTEMERALRSAVKELEAGE